MRAFRNLVGPILRRIHAAGLQYYSKQQLLALYGFLFIGALALGVKQLGIGKKEYPLNPRSRAAQQREVDEFLAIVAREKLQDSLHFYLPSTDSNLASVSASTEIRSVAPRTAPPKAQAMLGKTIALNKASRDELMQLPSIGPSTADRILGYRRVRGRFQSLLEITNVDGIGMKKYELLKQFLRLD